MTEATPAQRSGLTPHITIGHGKGQAAVAFYKAAFAAEEAESHLAEDGRRLMHCHLTINGGTLLLNDDFPEHRAGGYPEPAGCVLHLQVEDADAWWTRALKAGAIVRLPLADQFWGDRYGQLQDPFGFSWSIGGPVSPSP
jgi:PhnB protein